MHPYPNYPFPDGGNWCFDDFPVITFPISDGSGDYTDYRGVVFQCIRILIESNMVEYLALCSIPAADPAFECLRSLVLPDDTGEVYDYLLSELQYMCRNGVPAYLRLLHGM